MCVCVCPCISSPHYPTAHCCCSSRAAVEAAFSLSVAADNMNRVRLKPTGVTGGEYINASFLDVSESRGIPLPDGAPHTVFVQGYKLKNAYMQLRLHCRPLWVTSGGWSGNLGAGPLSCSAAKGGRTGVYSILGSVCTHFRMCTVISVA